MKSTTSTRQNILTEPQLFGLLWPKQPAGCCGANKSLRMLTGEMEERTSLRKQQRLQWRFRLSASTVAIQGFHDRGYRVDRRHPNRQALGATATPGGPLSRCPALLRFLLKVTRRCAPATS
ncbi:hypothetical protein EYF80_029997 [Liparis tanakae]|uniref:Uncharacterized protein n=1 Tax=Liparis tanakae TaxID=230148 RepID=A0A4Z2H4I9_9TELE|nr:hypothetical protein EYF80_029997 [Liparis tanakae]